MNELWVPIHYLFRIVPAAMLRNIAILALGALATALPQPVTDIPAVVTKAPTGTEPGAAPTRVSPDPTGPTSHGPYSGSASITGNKPAGTAPLALKFDGPAVPNPTATYYNPDGILRSAAQLPFTPGGKYPYIIPKIHR